MCTYQTTSLAVSGSGKGASGWFALSDASVYFDHPVHAGSEHTLNIDLLNPSRGPGFRVALELDPTSARALAAAILQTLDDVPLALWPDRGDPGSTPRQNQGPGTGDPELVDG